MVHGRPLEAAGGMCLRAGPRRGPRRRGGRLQAGEGAAAGLGGPSLPPGAAAPWETGWGAPGSLPGCQRGLSPQGRVGAALRRLCSPGVSTVTAPSASPPTSSGTCATFTTRRSPSGATCATAASGSRPTWTGTSRSTSTSRPQVRPDVRGGGQELRRTWGGQELPRGARGGARSSLGRDKGEGAQERGPEGGGGRRAGVGRQEAVGEARGGKGKGRRDGEDEGETQGRGGGKREAGMPLL